MESLPPTHFNAESPPVNSADNKPLPTNNTDHELSPKTSDTDSEQINHADLETLEITLEHKYPGIEEVHKYSAVLIRHAYSQFNYIQKQFELATGENDSHEDALPHRLNKLHFDGPLHHYGVLQAKLAQKSINAIEFDAVFVSPMRRAMETSYYMFETHPDRANIKFIVCPLLREFIGSANDIPFGTLAQLKELYTNKGGVTYDFSLFQQYEDPEHWFFEVISNKEKKKLLKERLVHSQEGRINYEEIFFTELAKCHPKLYETKSEGYTRAMEFKEFMKLWRKENPSVGSKKIAIVSHSILLSCITAKSIEGEVLDDHHRFKNCEIKPFDI